MPRTETIGLDPDYLIHGKLIDAVEERMRVSDKVLKCVVFIGLKKDGVFEPIGTGFITVKRIDELGFQYLVTAWHVIQGENGQTLPVCIRVNERDGTPKYIEPPLGWFHHQDHSRYIDVAVAPILLDPAMFDIASVPFHHFCAEGDIAGHDIGIGEELFYPGLFMPHRGVSRNLPVMRFGVLAAMPIEPVRTQSGPIKAYLMEGRSIGGHSGSPVFVNLLAPRNYYADKPFWTPHANAPDRMAYRLLGLIRGYLRVQDSGEYATGDPKDRKEEDLWVNSGISTVIPSWEIMETINQDSLEEIVAKAVREHREKSADMPTSVAQKKLAPDAIDANPKHKEDFEQLLGKAVKPQNEK